MRRHELIEFYQLVVLSLDGSATDAQVTAMMQKIKEDDQAARFYAELLSIYANLACPSLAEPVLERLHHGPADLEQSHVSAEEAGIWNALLDMEMTAPGVEIEKPAEPPKTDTKKPAQASSGKKHTFWMYTSVVASAALVLLLLYARIALWYMPREVATLTSSVEVQWDVGSTAVNPSQRLRTKTPFRLKKGWAELVFDEGAKVVVEAPASFELIGTDRMLLRAGRLSALVSEEAQGFTVDTPSTRVIDLGTEFGVHASKHNNALVQVYAGEASLSLKSASKTKVLIKKGQARRVSAAASKITEMPFEPRAFVTAQDFVTIRDETSGKKEKTMATHPALCLHLDASRVMADAGQAVRFWRDISPTTLRRDAALQSGTALYVADALGQGLGAIDFGHPALDAKAAPTQMKLMTQADSKVFLDQTDVNASGFTVALVLKVQSHGTQDWSNIIGNTSIIDVPGFFVRWHDLDAQPIAAAFLGGQTLRQDCAFIGDKVVLVCTYDRKHETLSLWNSSTHETSRKTVRAGDFTASDDTELASDFDHNLYLGAFGKSKKRYVDGLIGEVRIYSQALEVQDLMTLKDELIKKWDVTVPSF